MSGLTNYALVGAGRVGKAILSSLLSSNPSARILVLSRSDASAFSTNGASSSQVTTIAVDYTSPESITTALKAHDTQILIDTVNFPQSEFHQRLAAAGKEAGIKLFVPSEFGGITEGFDGPAGPLKEKAITQEYLKKIELPYVLIQSNAFIEFLPWLAGSYTGKFNIVGKGDTPVSTTAIEDVAGFLVHVLKTYPVSQLANSSFRIEGDRGTLRQFASRLNFPVEVVERVPDAPDAVNVDTSKPNFQTAMQRLFDVGKGSSGWNYQTGKDEVELIEKSKSFWEGHVWKKLEDVHAPRA